MSNKYGLWSRYKLTLVFTNKFCGGKPRHPDVIDAWIKSRAATEARYKGMVEAKGADKVTPLDAIVEKEAATIDPLTDEEETIAKAWKGFSCDEQVAAIKRVSAEARRKSKSNGKAIAVVEQKQLAKLDGLGLFIPTANVRAMFKEAAQRLGKAIAENKVQGMLAIRAFRSKLANQLWVEGDRIHLCDANGKVVTEATGYDDITMSVTGPRGDRTCLSRIDYVSPCQLECVIKFSIGELKPEWMEVLLEYCEVTGLGQDRSMQKGRFTWTLEAIE